MWIFVPDNVMTLSQVTVNFKLDNKVVLFPFIMPRKFQSHIVRSSGMESMNCRTEESVEFSSSFKIVGCLTGRELKSKSAVCYIIYTLVLDPLSLLCRMIQRDCSGPDVKIFLLAKTLAIESFLKVD